MKSSIFYLPAIAAVLVFFSCNQSDNKTTMASSDDSVNVVAKTECFISADKLDSAFLNLKTLKNGKVKGSLVFTFVEKGKNDGEIEGMFKGDTLYVDYTFKIGSSQTIYKNPLALLKRDGKLILGVGQIETTLGRSYFVKGKPINFDKGRFTFIAADCQEK
ncbi:hypothetical protein [Pedobacter frigoris]|uniref:Lipoprotein n=1 Tax=Pedobacter frigoris TaxID=2571272 RepID=A0A4U1CF83_9SPHI|nr:hypothetical protein [Pedobacter frigoris]TKC04253.1 hypothetical protein FA047_16800 [Pedobacter frigoris]